MSIGTSSLLVLPLVLEVVVDIDVDEGSLGIGLPCQIVVTVRA